jgi:hypothetical protein
VHKGKANVGTVSWILVGPAARLAAKWLRPDQQSRATDGLGFVQAGHVAIPFRSLANERKFAITTSGRRRA